MHGGWCMRWVRRLAIWPTCRMAGCRQAPAVSHLLQADARRLVHAVTKAAKREERASLKASLVAGEEDAVPPPSLIRHQYCPPP